MTVAEISPLPLGTFAAPARAKTPLPALPDANNLPPVAPADPLPRMEQEDASTADGRPPEPDFTDQDLVDALAPLVRNSELAPSAIFADDFEAMLRTSLRRALAQHTRGPFEEPDLFQRMRWRLDALFSSRSYEEVVEARSHRFHIEEAHLLDDQRLSSISYASANLSRHLHPRRAIGTADRIATRLRALGQSAPLEFTTDDGFHCVVLPQANTLLAALVRGRPDAEALVDLDCIHRRIHARFGDRLARTEPLLEEIQPLLEECLLIHSPLAPLAR